MENRYDFPTALLTGRKELFGSDGCGSMDQTSSIAAFTLVYSQRE